MQVTSIFTVRDYYILKINVEIKNSGRYPGVFYLEVAIMKRYYHVTQNDLMRMTEVARIYVKTNIYKTTTVTTIILCFSFFYNCLVARLFLN